MKKVHQFADLSREQLAEAFGRDIRTIGKWQKEGMPHVSAGKSGKSNAYCLVDCIRWAARNGKFGQAVAEGEICVATEKARLTKEQADHAALKNAQLRRELIPVYELRLTWEKVVINARAKLLLIPQKAHSLAGLDEKELKKVIAQWIEEALLELSRGCESGVEIDSSAAEADD